MPAACGDFIFLRAQKNEEKKGRPCGGLAQRVVIAVASRSHRRTHTSLLTTRSKYYRGILCPLVRVVDHALWSAPPKSHV